MFAKRILLNSLNRKTHSLIKSRQLWTNQALQSSGAYQADGKTKVTMLETEMDNGLMITNYSMYGFRLNNDLVVVGPMAIFPRSVLSWNVNSFEDINEDSLSIFCGLEPKLDLLILGIGDQGPTPAFSRTIIKFMRQYKINTEVLRTEQACATFNFLNAESRMVAAALIPPTTLKFNENDILQTKLKRQELYKSED